MFVSGLNGNRQLIVPPNAKEPHDGLACVCPPRKLKIDLSQISKFSIGSSHSVFVTNDGQLFAAGNDEDFSIGTQTSKIFEELTVIQIKGMYGKFLQVFCGQDYSVYLDSDNRVAYCTGFFPDRLPVIHQFSNKVVFLSGGINCPFVIDSFGDLYVFHRNPKKEPNKYTFQNFFGAEEGNEERIYDACSLDELGYLIVVSFSGKVLMKKPSDKNFILVQELIAYKISRVFGYSTHCIALSRDGHVFAMGSNESGQLGNGTTRDSSRFIEIADLLDKKIIEASVGCDYSLFLAEDGKLYGCGSNCYGELMLRTMSDECVKTPTICCFDDKAKYIWTGNNSSVALVEEVSQTHPGIEYFREKL